MSEPIDASREQFCPSNQAARSSLLRQALPETQGVIALPVMFISQHPQTHAVRMAGPRKVQGTLRAQGFTVDRQCVK
jgi:hypothetical protein